MKRLGLFLIFLACMLASLVCGIWMLGCIIVGSDRAWAIALAFDRVLNVSSGGNAAETVSSRAGRAVLVERRWGCILCRLLDLIDRDHCVRNIIKEFLTDKERAIAESKST